MSHLIDLLDLYPSNILFQLADLDMWSEEEIYDCVGKPMREPVHRRDGDPTDETVPQYLVQPCNMQALENRLLIEKILIIDFGQAFYLNETPDVLTPKQFSAPELLFGTTITPAIEQWQLGCTVFEICSGFNLLTMLFNPKMDVMKDMVAMLGKPPDTMWQRWKERGSYFEADGTPKATIGRKIAVRPYPLIDRLWDIVRLDEKALRQQSKPMTRASNRSRITGLKLPNDELIQLHDLLINLMVYEPTERLPIDQTLIHPFFNAVAEAD